MKNRNMSQLGSQQMEPLSTRHQQDTPHSHHARHPDYNENTRQSCLIISIVWRDKRCHIIIPAYI